MSQYVASGQLIEEHILATVDAKAIYDEKSDDFDHLKFALSDRISEIAEKDDAIDQLKKLLGLEEEENESEASDGEDSGNSDANAS